MSASTGLGVENYAGAFERFSHEAHVPEAVAVGRREAWARFAEVGFPTTKNEDWHYTSVGPIAESEFTPLVDRSGDVSSDDIAPYLFDAGSAGWHLAVFVNGRFTPELSALDKLPAGVRVRSLADSWRDDRDPFVGKDGGPNSYGHAFTSLNTAFLYDGCDIRVDPDVDVADPIHVMYVTDATAAKAMIHPRTTVRAGRNARARVIESFVATSDARYLTNAFTDIRLDDGATLHHYKVQRESQRAFHVGTVDVFQQRDSHFVSFSFAIGGELSRTNVYTTLGGAGCGATLNGLYMLDGAQHCDHQTMIVHAQPNCYSREIYKGILDGRSHGVFNGKVYVHPIAQKTDGKQTSKVLLLSDKAQIDAKPQLEIFADDVKCTHGATVGQIDRTALFYMKSRGIAGDTARRLLTYAFAAEVLEALEVDEVREGLERLTLDRFAGQAAT